MIGIIAVILTGIISTELIYFLLLRDAVDGFGDFIGMKIMSMMGSALVMAILIGIPYSLANEFGVKMWYWSYGVAGGIVAFFGINWGIHCAIENRVKRKKK